MRHHDLLHVYILRGYIRHTLPARIQKKFNILTTKRAGKQLHADHEPAHFKPLLQDLHWPSLDFQRKRLHATRIADLLPKLMGFLLGLFYSGNLHSLLHLEGLRG